MSTLDDVRKAYADLSEDDKKKFHQALADRVHESLASQERAQGTEDSQSAEAREHEALGEEHAHGEGEVRELHEKDDTANEKAEDSRDRREYDDRLDRIEKSLNAVVEALGKKSSAEEKAEEVYGLGNGIFQSEEKVAESKKMMPKDISEILARIKR